MKKSDLLIVAGLFMLLLLWPIAYNHIERIFGLERAPEPDSLLIEESHEEDVVIDRHKDPPRFEAPPDEEITQVEQDYERDILPVTDDYADDSDAAPLPAGDIFDIRSDKTELKFTSMGAGLVSAQILDFRATIEQDSPPVILDFTENPALTYSQLPGFSRADKFAVTTRPDGTIEAFAERDDGLRLKRTIIVEKDYSITVQDVFENTAGSSIRLPRHRFWLGPMSTPETESRTRGFEYLGVDAHPAVGGESVIYWSKHLSKLFQEKRAVEGGAFPRAVYDTDARLLRKTRLFGRPNPLASPLPAIKPVDWVAAKNKFFVQIAAPMTPSDGYAFRAEREMLPGEGIDPGVEAKNVSLLNVRSALVFDELEIEPGKSFSREINYYAGPKKYSILRELGKNQDAVMEFGFWTPVCKIVITALNAIYRYVPNYGVAIILLTIAIRLVFWPITRKGTESMKKMQTLQPLIAELKKKHKSDPKKLNEETMKLYKEHKVNPMGGCLPMLIQIPVFISLFVVLRSAIEMRFAEFLWVKDLSEPERLFSEVLPFPLNILPILMAVTMVVQQKLTPTGDSSQQKMMMVFMPAMMLFICYNFASALALYWTANQMIAIVVQLFTRLRAKPETGVVRKT